MFEYLLRDLQYNQDFEILYEYIKTFGKELTALKLKMIDKNHLKSNHYWLMAIIPKLTQLKTLKLYINETVSFGKDGHNYLTKAFQYFNKNGGKLQKFQMTHFTDWYGEYLYPYLKTMQDLEIIHFKNNSL